jgi:DNA-binding LacI/PurR family transcriptional regulator
VTTPTRKNKRCERTNKFILERLAAETPDTVVLGGHWALYGTESTAVSAHLASLRETVRHLKSLGIRRIIVFGHLPTWTIPQPNVLMKQWRKAGTVAERTHEYLEPSSVSYNKVIERALEDSGATFVSPIALLCTSAGCQVSTLDKGVFHSVTSDNSHLTAHGSEIVIQRSAAAIFD